MDDEPHEPILFADEVFRIQGAVFEVDRVMGRGVLEAVYQECLAVEFAKRRIPFCATPPVRLTYKGVELKQVYVPDFVCFGALIVELKAARDTVAEHRAQLLNCLRASRLRFGLLVNFGASPRTTVERLAL